MFKKVIITIFALLLISVSAVVVYAEFTIRKNKLKQLEPVQVVKTFPDQDQLWDLVNNWRKDNSLPKYTRHEGLCVIAEKRATEISTDFNHRKLTSDEYYPLQPMIVSENISKSDSATSALSGWLGSRPHAQALNDNFTHSCIKCDNNYCVQLFAQ